MNDELEEIYPKLKQVIKIAEDMLNTVESELRYRERQIAKIKATRDFLIWSDTMLGKRK